MYAASTATSIDVSRRKWGRFWKNAAFHRPVYVILQEENAEHKPSFTKTPKNRRVDGGIDQQDLALRDIATAQDQGNCLLMCSTLLAEQSAYFERRISSGMVKPDEIAADGNRRLITQIPHQLFAAAELALQFVYEGTGALPAAALRQTHESLGSCRTAGTDATFLLQVYEVANTWEMAECMAACMAALSKLQPADLRISDICYAYSLPVELRERPGIVMFLNSAVCKARALELLAVSSPCTDAERLQLLTCLSRQVSIISGELGQVAMSLLFGDVPKVLREQSLQQLFCALPQPAVLTWAQLDALTVHSENCVVLLLSRWARSEQGGQRCSTEQLREVAEAIRLVHCSLNYLVQLNQQPGWISAVGEGLYPWLAEVMVHHSAPKALSLHRDIWTGPAAWHAASPRAGTIPSDKQALTLTWEVEEDQIACLKGPLYSSTAVYLNGFDGLRLVLEPVWIEPAQGLEPAAMPRCTVRVALSSDPGSEAAVCCVDLAVRAMKGSGGRKQAMHGLVSGRGCAQGWSNFFGKSGSTPLEVVEPFMVAGKLQLQAVVRRAA